MFVLMLIFTIAWGLRKELVYNWKADVEVGEYLAKAAIVYDEGTVNLEESFNVGTRELELKEINVEDFTLGQIAKLQMLVENKWSDNIGGVFIETTIKDDDEDVVSSFQSSAQDIEGSSKKNFDSYWDTAGVREGEYDAQVSINYGAKSSENNLKFKVSDDELVILGLGYVISDSSGGDGNTIVVVLVAVIVVMVLINLLWFFMLRKKLGGAK
jgi:hypothetical protein